jgi:hypothetical protein
LGKPTIPLLFARQADVEQRQFQKIFPSVAPVEVSDNFYLLVNLRVRSPIQPASEELERLRKSRIRKNMKLKMDVAKIMVKQAAKRKSFYQYLNYMMLIRRVEVSCKCPDGWNGEKHEHPCQCSSELYQLIESKGPEVAQNKLVVKLLQLEQTEQERRQEIERQNAAQEEEKNREANVNKEAARHIGQAIEAAKISSAGPGEYKPDLFGIP